MNRYFAVLLLVMVSSASTADVIGNCEVDSLGRVHCTDPWENNK